ncbi:MAG: SDR family NAD(P)-dependent oxidoreductase [Haloarculaceae archaeon]
MEFDGRTALVTGASRNIGRGIATELAERGADVGVAARTDREGAEETARRVGAAGGESAVALADLADPSAVESMVETVREELGPIDVLVNNATYRPSTPFLDVGLDELDRVADVNFRGLFRTTQRVVPDMIDRGGGSVVNLVGAMVYLGLPGHTHSFGSKMAIEGLTRQLATELGPDGIRVNGVSPGLIDTDRNAGENWERIERQVVEATPLERVGEIGEVADACCYLASERASFVTGQTLHVNGGTYPTPTLVSRERS